MSEHETSRAADTIGAGPTPPAGEQETPHELVLTDTFAASPEQVWEAWTRPEIFAQWWHGPGWATSQVVIDPRPAGSFSARQTSPDGSITMPFDGFYRVVERPEMLVFTLNDPDRPDEPPRTEMTVQLREVERGTEQKFTQTGVVTDEHYEALKAGTQQFFGQLADLLSRRQGG